MRGHQLRPSARSTTTAKRRILLLGQDPRLRDICRQALESSRFNLVDVREAAMLPAMAERGADLVIIDQAMPNRSLEAAAAALGDHRELPVLVLASGSARDWHGVSRGSPLEMVLEAPFSAEELAARVEELLEKGSFLHQRLVGRSDAILELRDRILLIAPTPITVLITGESGTGKDIVARALHHYSRRSSHPFKAINCAAIPENLIENELFGHEKGAFTDARSQYRGIFEQSDGGTVFLDEIGEMPLAAQVRLLRVLEEREVTRVGGNQAISVDIRIIAATNRNLRKAVSEGAFRRDLYHRLKVAELDLPPLRQHREDLPLLLDHFVQQVSEEPSARYSGFSPAAMDLLLEYEWPGNTREVRNLVQHLAFLGPTGPVEPADLLPHLEQPPPPERHLPVATNKTPDQSERELIYFALLDLKREVADLRGLVEDRFEVGSARTPRPIFPAREHVSEPEFTPTEIELQTDGNGGVRSLKELEREAIEETLQQVGRNRRRAAEILGIGVRTLYRKLEEYGLK